MHEWVSVEEASRRLGCSVSTVRRRIEAGELVGEREVIGGSKERYRVRLETQQEPEPTLQSTWLSSESGGTSTPRHDAPAITERALAILDTVLRANAETMDRQAARIDQYAEMMRQEMERRVRAEAERDTLKLRVTDLAQLAAERQAELEELRDHLAEEAARLRAEAARRRWWRWWPW